MGVVGATAWATDLPGDVALDTCCVGASIGGRRHCACWYPARKVTRTEGPPPGHPGPRRLVSTVVPVGIHEATHWRHPAGYTRPIPAPLATAREAA